MQECLLSKLNIACSFSSPAPCRAMPHFTSTPYSVTVSEAAPIGSILINITAVPGTPGNSLIYNIFHNPTIIQIDNITGSITLVGSLDYEQDAIYEFNVEVFEGADVVMTGVTVDVVNENDNPLTCEQSLVVVSRPEGPPSPSSIPMSCVDRDEPSPESVSYQIVSGNDTGLFHIDIHGTIHVVSELDYEKETLHELIVSATSGGTLMLSPDSTLLITVLVVVEPTNEYSPVFDNAEVMFTFSISESAAIGTTIGTIHATDADHGKDGDLVFSADSEVPQTVFTIGSTTGQLVLIDSLDYEQATSHELTVTVSDSSPVASKRRSVIATVLINVENVNEYNPAFSEEVYSVSISEVVTAGSEIASVECTDTDSNSTLTYSIESGNNASHFSINSFTGKVTLASQVEFDPNRPSPFQLIVQCEDSGSPSRTTRATLFVEIEGHSRNMPPALSSTEFMIELSENSSLGTMVVSLATVATDSNRGLAGPLQFSLVHNSSCPEDVFQIVPTSGLIYTVGVLDYETADEYQCVVSVSNMESTASAELGISISVTNLNDEVPLCSPSLYTLTIPEDGAVGSDLLTLSCSDADNDGLEYSIVGTSNTFQLTQSGTQTSTLSLLAPVNFDVFSTHHLHINVSDSQHSLQLTLFVYVEQSNEHAPTFNQSVYDCSVPEITAIGSVLCTVVARDSDSGPDGHIRYSIISGNDENTFAINSLSGDIVLTGYIDYETIQGHIVLVQASDNGDSPLNSSVQVRITVLDSNDNAPVISPLITATIAENSPAGSTVTDLECSDVDTGTNGDVIMNIQSLSSINADGIEVADSEIIYGIESLTNKLVLDSIIDFEAGILYKLTLTCRDNGIQPLTSSSTILISVTPLNEFAPVLNKNYSATVAESSGIGTSILQVMATDKDAGLDGHIKYSIEPEEDGKDFLHIGATSGHVSSQKPLNCAWGTEHGFTITAVDKGFPALSSQSKLYVTFENCQLGQLTPQQAIYFANVMENSPVNTEVMTVACDTERVWEGGNAPEYGILNPVESPFKIDPVSGRISISTPLDYEQTTSYMLQLNCTDPSRPLSYAYFSVYVTVLPDNEYPPEFSLATYEAEVAEDVPPGTSVLEVEARDNDSGNDGSVVYSIQESMQSFAVDSRTGVIFTLAFLDREEESFYLFHIAAVDQLAQGDSMHSSVTEIRVSVMDTNDNSPQCDRVVYHINMSPIINVGHKIVGLECTDADSDLNSELHYSLYADSTSSLDLFSLDESTGDLFLARKLDSNSALVHQMTITIGDSGNPSLSTTALVVVEVRSSQVVIGGGSESYARVEGTNNAVTVTLKYLSMELVSTCRSNGTCT